MIAAALEKDIYTYIVYRDRETKSERDREEERWREQDYAIQIKCVIHSIILIILLLSWSIWPHYYMLRMETPFFSLFANRPHTTYVHHTHTKNE